MKKGMKVLLPVIQGFVLCAMALQIILGVVYIGANLGTVPKFRDTVIYLEMAEHFVADEYTGLLYPFLVKLCYAIPLIPFQIPIYMLQIVLGIYCVYYFIHVWTDRKGIAFWFSLWINTIPFVAQAHVTVLPHSVAMSCLVIMLLQVLRGSIGHRPLSGLEWAELLCTYLLLAQLTRGYLFVGTLLVIWAALLQFYRRSKRILLFLVAMILCVGMLVINVAVYHTTEQRGYYGRIQKTDSSVFFQRVGTKILSGKYLLYMPTEVADCYNGAELDDIGKYPYKIETEFGPRIELTYGREQADEIYRELGKLGLFVATKENILAMVKDGLGYMFPIAMYGTWQNGDLKGVTSWNYQQFLEEVPVWSHAYVQISHCLWLIGFVGSIVIFMLLAIFRKRGESHVWLPVIIYLCLYAGIMAWNGADVYDYKLALLPMIMSYAPMSILAIGYIFNKG